MLQTKQEPVILRDDAVHVEIGGEKKHFICIAINSNKEEGYTYELFDDEGYITSIDDKTLRSYLSLGAVIIKPTC